MKIEQALAEGLDRLLATKGDEGMLANLIVSVAGEDYLVFRGRTQGGDCFLHIRDDQDRRRLLLEMEDEHHLRPNSRFDVLVRQSSLLHPSREHHERVYT